MACQTRKGDLPEFVRHEDQPTPPSLSKPGDMRTGKKAGLLKCFERSPLCSGNADEEEALVDETNNNDYEETVDPVTYDIAIEELSDSIGGTELEPCTQEEEQLISKDIAAYLAADRSPEAGVMILDGAFVAQCSPPGHQTLSMTTATASSCIASLDNFRVFNGWILFETFISQTA